MNWNIYFSEVFKKGGFDIAITNPPYVNIFELEKDKNFDKQFYRNKYISASGAFDLYVLFHERCIELVNPGGISTLISPNKFLSAEYAKKLRRYIVENATFIDLLDLSSVRIFEAGVYPVVSLYKKTVQNRPIRVFRGYGAMGNIRIQEIGEFPQRELKDSPELIWSFLIFGSLSIYKKMNNHHRIIDVCDITASFSVDEAYKMKRLIREDSKTTNGLEYKKLLISSNIHKYHATWGHGSITYLKTKYKKPVVELDAQTLSKNRLKQIKNKKIIIAGMTRKIRAFLDADGQYVAGIPTIILTNFKVDSRYILSLINSKLYDFYFHQLFGSLSLAGGYLRIGTPQVSILPFKQISEREQKPFIELVDKIHAITKDDDYLENPDKQAKVHKYEKQIDQFVYRLYNLTSEEIAEICSKNN